MLLSDAAGGVAGKVASQPLTDAAQAADSVDAPALASDPLTVEPGADEDTGTIAPEGRESTVKTAKGTKVATGFKVIEARNLVISHETDGTVRRWRSGTSSSTSANSRTPLPWPRKKHSQRCSQRTKRYKAICRNGWVPMLLSAEDFYSGAIKVREPA